VDALIEPLKRKGVEYEVKEYKGKVRGIEWKTGRTVIVRGEGLPDQEVDEKRLCVFDATPSQLQTAVGEEIGEEEEQDNGTAEDSEGSTAQQKEDGKKNNVDVILLNSTLALEGRRRKPTESFASFNRRRKALFKDAQSFLACGELKSGIDPAGADEHFK